MEVLKREQERWKSRKIKGFKEEEDDLERIDAAVHVVAEKKVVHLSRVACLVQHVHQVVVLAVDVADDYDRLLDGL